MRLYLDAVVIIYAVEKMEPWAKLVAARMTDAHPASPHAVAMALVCIPIQSCVDIPRNAVVETEVAWIRVSADVACAVRSLVSAVGSTLTVTGPAIALPTGSKRVTSTVELVKFANVTVLPTASVRLVGSPSVPI